MEFLLDTINLDEIKEGIEFYPISGVTSNPSIVKKTSPSHFYDHMREVRQLIGKGRTLHIQVISQDLNQILKEAERIHQEIDEDVYIKVPVNQIGLKAIKLLKAKGYKVTATAIYDLMQAYLALEAGADYIAPYVNRMSNLGSDPFDLIEHLSYRIMTDAYECKIVGASYKNINQIKDSFNAGAQSVTVSYDLLKLVCANPSIDKAIDDFNLDWQSVYGDKDCSNM